MTVYLTFFTSVPAFTFDDKGAIGEAYATEELAIQALKDLGYEKSRSDWRRDSGGLRAWGRVLRMKVKEE